MRPTSQALNGVATANTLLMENGTATLVSAYTGTIADGAQVPMHYQVRARDEHGAASPWVVVGSPAAPAFIVVNGPEMESGSPLQYKLDGVTSLTVGATTTETGIKVRASVRDKDSENLRIQVELRAVDQPLEGAGAPVIDGVNYFESPVVFSSSETTYVSAWATLDPIPNGVSYQWAARVVDSTGVATAWKSYGTNAENPPNTVAATDFKRGTNAVPSLAGPSQHAADGTLLIVGAAHNAGTLLFRATVNDTTPGGQLVKLRVEVKPIAQSFTGGGTSDGAYVTAGAVAEVNVSGLADGAYHWRARAVDSTGGLSVWVSFGGNLETSADVTIDTVGPTTTITDQPANPTPQTTANFSFTADEAPVDFQHRIDGGAWSLWSPSLTAVYNILAPGGHAFEVRARDAAQNVGAADSYNWVISGGNTIVAVTLTTGWNLVARAVDTAPLSASALATEIDAQNGAGFVQKVQRWTGSQWQTYDPALPFTDFALAYGQGYFVRTTGAGTWTSSGTPPASVPVGLAQGFNGVGVPYAGMTASSLKAQLDTSAGAAIVTKIQTWTGSQWQTYDPTLPFTNFALSAGKGYFVETSAAGNALITQP